MLRENFWQQLMWTLTVNGNMKKKKLQKTVTHAISTMKKQSLENRSDAMDTDVEDDDPPVIQHTTPMAMIENVIDVSQFRSGPVRGQSGVRVRGGLVRGGRVRGSRVCGGANARVIRGARVRGGRAAALGVRIPHNNTQTKCKAQSEVPFEDIPDPFPFHENCGSQSLHARKCMCARLPTVVSHRQCFLII